MSGDKVCILVILYGGMELFPVNMQKNTQFTKRVLWVKLCQGTPAGGDVSWSDHQESGLER